MVAREGFLRQKPKAVDSLLRGLLEAEAFLARQPAEADRLVGRALDRSPAQVAEQRKNLGLRVSLNEDLLTLMEDEARWIVSQGLAETADLPNCFALVHFEPLELLKPEAVGIIH